MNQLTIDQSSLFLQVESYDDQGNFFYADGKDYGGVVFEASTIDGLDTRLPSAIAAQLQSCPDGAILQFTLLTLPDFDAGAAYAHGKHHGNEVAKRLVIGKARLLQKLATHTSANLALLNTKRLFISLALPISEPRVASEAYRQSVSEFKVGLQSIFGNVSQLDPAMYRQTLRQCMNPLRKAPHSPRFDLRENFNAQVFDPSNTVDFMSSKHYGVVDDTVKFKVVTPLFLPETVHDAFMAKISALPFEKSIAADPYEALGVGDYKLKIANLQSTVIEVCNQEETYSQLKDAAISIKNDEVGRQAPGAMGFFLQKMQIGNIDTQKALTEINALLKAKAGRIKYVKASYCAILFSEDDPLLEQEAVGLRNHLQSPALGFEAVVVSNGTHGPRLVNALPLNYSKNLQEKLASDVLMTSKEAAAIIPVFGSRSQSRYGAKDIGMGLVSPAGQLVFFSPFIGAASHNGFVSGGSGGGKSFTLCELISAKIAAGAKVYAFDNGESFKKLALRLGGNYIHFQPEFLPSVNPFPGLVGNAMATDREAELLSVMLLRIPYPQGQSNPAGSELAVKQAIKASLKTIAAPLQQHLSGNAQDSLHGLSDVIRALESGRDALMAHHTNANDRATSTQKAAMDLIAPLKDFAEDSIRGNLLKGKSTLDLSAQLNVFEFKALSSNAHLRSIIVFFLMSKILDDINFSENPRQEKIFIIDEAQDLFGGGTGDELEAKILEQMFSKLRKEQGAIWIGAQNMITFADRPSAPAIFTNCPWRIYHAMPPDAVSKLIQKELLPQDDSLKRTILDMQRPNKEYGELVIHETSSGYYQKLRLYVDQFAQILYSTSDFHHLKDDPDQLDQALALASQEGGSQTQAIEKYLQWFSTHSALGRQEAIAQLRAALKEGEYA